MGSFDSEFCGDSEYGGIDDPQCKGRITVWGSKDSCYRALTGRGGIDYGRVVEGWTIDGNCRG